MTRVSILLPLALEQTYDYKVPRGRRLSAGQFVRVPLRKKEVVGVVWCGAVGDALSDATKLREVIEVLEHIPPLNDELMNFIDWVADYTLSPRGMVLKLAMGPTLLFKPLKRKAKAEALAESAPTKTKAFPTWGAGQKKALEEIEQLLAAGGYQSILLEGVTGSGKTEINFHLMLKAIERGQARGQALFLLPEIALADDMLNRFQSYSNLPTAVWHSGMTPAKRRDQWQGVASGKIKIVIGARSALFLPFEDLKFIAVDEEHDEGFKQSEGVVYHARDMAIVRAHLKKIPVLLSSATPCLETLYNVRHKKCAVVKIEERVQLQAVLPEIKLIDMKKEKLKANRWLSAPLVAAIGERLERKEQVLLFLNRRGFAPLTLCRKCGFRFSCLDCSAWLAHHRAHNILLCHHCGITQEIPSSCPQCGGVDTLAPCGPGVERIFEEVKELFPRASLACLSRDLPTELEARAEILTRMKNGTLDILIGTQIIAKGHHFPRLTLAGVVDADLSLANADLRAAERCFHLLQQVAGRTGREDLPGEAFLQTYNPEHPVMTALAASDSARFIQTEQKERKAGAYPPFGKLAAIILSGEDKAQVEAYAKALRALAPQEKNAGVKILGPAPAPIFRRAKRYRVRFLLKSNRGGLQPYLRLWLARAPALPATMRRLIDIDPHSFL